MSRRRDSIRAAAQVVREDGYVVFRSLLAADALGAEHDATLQDAFTSSRRQAGSAGNEFRYVPTMCERTPVSIGLVVQFASVAADLVGSAVLPSRAKATEYHGDTDWHRDSDRPTISIGFVAYLDALDEESGALRVRRGSHRRGVASRSCAVDVIATAPGDVIIFDEHLWHASIGGGQRRQWRVDYVADTGDDQALRAYFTQQYAPGWDPGYDPDRYPSYGPSWRALDARWNERLDALGAYAAADAEEAFMRGRRRDDATR